jgi:hypothetical protein
LGADANAFYELMTNEKKSEEAVAEFLGPGYIQHNPLVPDGAAGLAALFGKMTTLRSARRISPKAEETAKSTARARREQDRGKIPNFSEMWPFESLRKETGINTSDDENCGKDSNFGTKPAINR